MSKSHSKLLWRYWSSTINLLRLERLIEIAVIANAKLTKIVAFKNGFKVWVQAPAVDGKANQAVIAALATHFKIKKNTIEIVSGQQSRQKVVKISD